jgi:hypothetical protein
MKTPKDRHGMPVDRRGFLKGAAAGAALFADSGASPSAEVAPLPPRAGTTSTTGGWADGYGSAGVVDGG